MAVAKMASHAIFQYNVLMIDIDNTTLGLIWLLKMTILRLLSSSDDKEKIGVARPEGPHLRWFRLADGGRRGAAPRKSQGSALKPLRSKGQELKRPWRNPSQKDQDEDNFLSPVKPMISKLHSSVQWTWHRINRRWVFYTHRCNGLGGRRDSRSFTGTG